MRHGDLDVVIVSWNTRALLRPCLESLRGEPAGIVVVDNASSDGSVEMLAVEFPEARLIRNPENVGFARACNQGIAACSARYVLLLNSDTQVERGALGTLVAFMDATPKAGACGPQLRNPDGSLQPSGRRFPDLPQSILAMVPLPDRLRRGLAPAVERRDYSRACEVDEINGAALCLRTDALARVGALDERFFFFGEDVDLCWRLREAGWSVHYVPEAVVRHEGGGSRRGQSARTSLLTQRAYVQLLLKHRPGVRAGVLVGVALGLTVLKGMRRGLAAWLRGGRDDARESWRLHGEELRWLARRWREPWAA